MAKRESQGLQIALILTVMAAVLLAVTTILFWNNATKATAAADAAKNQSQEANNQLSQTVRENQTLREMIGYAADESLENITTNHAADMVRFGQYPEQQQNYRELPIFLDQTLQQQLARINELEERIAQLEEDKTQLTEERTRLVKVEKDAHDKAGQDLLATRDEWTTADRSIEEQRRELIAKHKSQLGELNKRLAKAKGDLERLREDNQSLEGQLRRKNVELAELQDESFEIPDGQITWVTQQGAEAYVNLGELDSLRRQVTFSVYDMDANGITSGKKKGSIEILEIIDDHQARARITEDDVSNPIVKGDVIYSPVWEAGNPIRFALSGFMDIDGDGYSDRELIKRLIAVNGGVIDAEITDDGDREGDISIRTRFLVVGDNVAENTGNPKLAAAHQAMLRDAGIKGLTQISVDRLLSDLGYQRVAKAVALGEYDEAP